MADTVRIETLPDLGALPPAAAALLDAAGAANFFFGRAFLATVAGHALEQGARPCFVLAWHGARPVAVLALQRVGGRLASLTSPYSCLYTPALAADLSPEARRAVGFAFGRFARRWPVVRLDALDAERGDLADLLAGAGTAGLVLVRFRHFGNWHEAVGSWQHYLNARPSMLRTTIQRKLRRWERLPEAGFTLTAGGEALEAGIAAFEQVYARSWKEPEPFPDFNAALMREAAAAGVLRLGLLRLGTTPIAAQVWLSEPGGRASVLKLAHDEGQQALSPGTVLTAMMIRHLIETDGARELDFGRGDDDYKKLWVGARRQRVGVLLIDPWRPAGLATLARHALGRLRHAVRPNHAIAEPR